MLLTVATGAQEMCLTVQGQQKSSVERPKALSLRGKPSF